MVVVTLHPPPFVHYERKESCSSSSGRLGSLNLVSVKRNHLVTHQILTKNKIYKREEKFRSVPDLLLFMEVFYFICLVSLRPQIKNLLYKVFSEIENVLTTKSLGGFTIVNIRKL